MWFLHLSVITYHSRHLLLLRRWMRCRLLVYVVLEVLLAQLIIWLSIRHAALANQGTLLDLRLVVLVLQVLSLGSSGWYLTTGCLTYTFAADQVVILRRSFIMITVLIQRDDAILINDGLRFEFCEALRYLIGLYLTPSRLPLRDLFTYGHHLHLMLRHGSFLLLLRRRTYISITWLRNLRMVRSAQCRWFALFEGNYGGSVARATVCVFGLIAQADVVFVHKWLVILRIVLIYRFFRYMLLRIMSILLIDAF